MFHNKKGMYPLLQQKRGSYEKRTYALCMIIAIVLITTFMNFFFEPLIAFFEGCNDTVLKVTATILMVIMVGDFLYAAYKMIKNKGPLIRWRLFLKK